MFGIATVIMWLCDGVYIEILVSLFGTLCWSKVSGTKNILGKDAEFLFLSFSDSHFVCLQRSRCNGSIYLHLLIQDHHRAQLSRDHPGVDSS